MTNRIFKRKIYDRLLLWKQEGESGLLYLPVYMTPVL